MNDQLDPQAMALTKAIRQVESGGNFKARSKDGSFGAYQFLKPTWDNTARKYGVNAEWEKATPQQQNEVAYKQIKEWKDKGHNVGEIASMWNAGAGRPQAYLQGVQGTNSSGVNYNVANYAKKVATLYQEYKGQSQPQVQQEPIEPVEPIEPTIQEQKQVIQTQGQPVSVRKDRTQPTLVGGIIRDIVKQPIKAALTIARPFVDPIGKKSGLSVNTKYLGNVGDYGTEIEKSTNNLANKYKAGEISLGRAALGGAGAGALQAMDFAAVAPVGKVASQAIRGTVKQSLVPTLKAAAKESLIRGGAVGAGYDVSSQLASGEKYNPLQTVAAGTVGTVADLGLSYGLPKTLNKGKEIIVKTPEQRSIGVDKDINKIYSNVTGDSGEIFKRKASFKRGIERLIQSDINIVSEKSPVGGKKIKNPLDPVKSSPNELINGLNNLSKQFAGKARANTIEATRKGIVLDTTATENFIRNAIDNKDIGRSAGEDLLTQIKRTEGRPVDLHDWVQNQVNMKFFKNNGDLASSKIATVADDAAKIMRKEIDTVVDRTGYAQAYGDNQELKKVMLSVAKSANKDFPFVDMATDVGIDAGISILTGNPAYMARTFATGLFKSVARNVKNQKGIGAFRNINKALKKTTITTKLPKSGVKEGIFNYKSVGNPLEPVNTSKSTTATTDKIITSKTIPTVSNTTGNKASIPVMMTNKLRADLKNLGYTPDDIANLKPVEANKIVNEGLKPRNTIIDVKSNTTQLPKSKVKSSDLSTPKKGIIGNAIETLKTLKDKNVRERGSISLEAILPESKSVGNQGVSLPKNTTEDLIQQAKKYKSAEEFVKNTIPSYGKPPGNPLYHGTSANIKSGKLTFGAGDGAKKGGQSGGHFLSESKQVSEVFAGNNGKVYIVDPSYKKNILDLTQPKGVKEFENYIGNKYKTYDGEILEFTKNDFDIMFPNGKTDFASISQYPELVEQMTKRKGYKGIAFDEYAGGNTAKTYQILHSDNIPVIEQSKISNSDLSRLIKEKIKAETDATDLRLEEYGRNQDGYLTDSQIEELDYLEKRIREIDNILLSSDYKSQLTDIWNKTNKKVTLPKSKDLSTELVQQAKKYKSAEEFVKAHETTGNVGTSFSRSTIFEKYPDIYQKNRMNIKPNAADKYDFHLSPLTNENFKLSNFENAEGFYKKPKIMKDLDGNTFAYLTKPFEKLGKQEKWNLRKVYDSTSKSEKPVFITEDGGKTFFTAENEVIGTGKTKSQLEEIWNKANKKILPKNTKLIRNKDGSVEYGSQKMSGDFKGMPDIEIIKMFEDTPF